MSRASKKTSKTSVVDRTRVTWVLFALVASMTIGTVFLGVLEPRKILTTDKTPLLAGLYTGSTSKIAQTSIPIESGLWQSVVIHTLRSGSTDDLTLRCAGGKGSSAVAHFAISPDAKILINSTWVSQEPVDRNSGKIMIGIQLVPGHSEATLDQAKALVALVKNLQALCNISRSRVVVHNPSTGRGGCTDPLSLYNWHQALLR